MLARLASFLSAALLAGQALASPVPVQERAVQAAPHFVYYVDKWTNSGQPPAPSTIPGWNVVALSFWLLEGPWDMVEAWTTLDDATRASIKSEYAAAGVKLVCSAFGSTDYPTTSGADPTSTAEDLAAFVIEWALDGVDVDYEDFTAMNGGTAEAWLITFTSVLRANLPADTYIITHAPVAPWFTDNTAVYPGGGYLEVDAQVGSDIDWYNIQFYNQGTTAYTDCTSLLTESNLADYPDTALFQIAANGVDLDKLVIGKPGSTGDASSGYMTPAALATCVAEAKADGWDAGLMVWQYPDADTNYVAEVWGS